MGANLRFRRAVKKASVQPARARQQAPAKRSMISNFLENRARARELTARENAEKARQKIRKAEQELEQKRAKEARELRTKAVEAAQARAERARLAELEARQAQAKKGEEARARQTQAERERIRLAEQTVKRERAEKEAAQRKAADMRAEQLREEAKLRTEIERARKEADKREISRLSNTRVEERRPAHEGRAAIARKLQAVYEEEIPAKKKKLVLRKAVRVAEPPSDDGRRRRAAVSEAEKPKALREFAERKERRPLIRARERIISEMEEKPVAGAVKAEAPAKTAARTEEKKPGVFETAQKRAREMKKSTEAMAPVPGGALFERLFGGRKRAEREAGQAEEKGALEQKEEEKLTKNILEYEEKYFKMGVNLNEIRKLPQEQQAKSYEIVEETAKRGGDAGDLLRYGVPAAA
ncbi:MAG: hypothetical protein V1911_02105, partial [Candidatus Micrarchaeota archaeon]